MICTRCGIDQPPEQFGPSAPMWPERRICRPCGRRITQIKRHGLPTEDRAIIAAAQGGCAICHHPEPSKKGWVVDHDRECCPGDKSCPKCRRGVVCQWCNSVLGYAFDRLETLRGAIAYLERPRDCTWHTGVECSDALCEGRTAQRIADGQCTNETDGTNGEGSYSPDKSSPKSTREANPAIEVNG